MAAGLGEQGPPGEYPGPCAPPVGSWHVAVTRGRPEASVSGQEMRVEVLAAWVRGVCCPLRYTAGGYTRLGTWRDTSCSCFIVHTNMCRITLRSCGHGRRVARPPHVPQGLSLSPTPAPTCSKQQQAAHGHTCQRAQGRATLRLTWASTALPGCTAVPAVSPAWVGVSVTSQGPESELLPSLSGLDS